MIQIDAADFEWLEDGKRYTLHGGIDDATGKLVGLHLSTHECLGGYFAVMQQIIKENGIPFMVYVDRRATFLSPKVEPGDKQENDTQFGRAMKELGIRMTPARSAQAKGRIERAWGTLQSRLPIELRLAKIANIDEANDFLAQYMFDFNKQFAVAPEDATLAYLPLAANINLALILCEKTPRKVDKGGVFSYNGQAWQLTDTSIANVTVEVVDSGTFGILALYHGNLYVSVPFCSKNQS